jgi:hypothetical protein
MPKPMFEVSPDVRKLTDFLHDRQHATYVEMNRRIGRQLNGADRHVLYGALRQLRREEIIFVAERNIGVRRATNGQVATLATDHGHRKIGRIVRKGRNLEPIVNTQEMEAEAREAFFKGCAVNQMVAFSISRKMRSKIAREIEDRAGEPVDVTEVVALFRKRAH